MSAWKPMIAGPVDQFEQLHHSPPAMHAAPADFPLGRESLAKVIGYIARFAERRGDRFLIAVGIAVPGIGTLAESMRITPYGRTPSSRSFLAMRRPCAPGSTNFCRSADRPSPPRRRSAAIRVPRRSRPSGSAIALCPPGV